jgi:diadenosine tetraphosphate (Ap4A) HIT family hydrolase
VPVTPEDFYASVLLAADEERRLPLPEQAMWEIFPFELAGLVVKPLDPLTLPEPPRGGEGGRDCSRCARRLERVVWSDERWTLSAWPEPLGLPFGAILEPKAHLDLGDLDDQHAAELGQLIVSIERAARLLSGVARVHVNKWGDGGAHLHVAFLGRPAGMLQLRGSCLPLWDEMLPRVPAPAADSALRSVAAALASRGGRQHP